MWVYVQYSLLQWLNFNPYLKYYQNVECGIWVSYSGAEIIAYVDHQNWLVTNTNKCSGKMGGGDQYIGGPPRF